MEPPQRTELSDWGALCQRARQGRDASGAGSEVGWTALSVASLNGHDGIVVRLLDHLFDFDQMKDVNAIIHRGETALSLATLKKNTSLAKKFLTHQHILVNKKNEHGKSPLQIAAAQNHEEILRLLRLHPLIDLHEVKLLVLFQ